MDLSINPEPPKIMHIDLNSCFASIEQQANPLLRNKPIAVAAYNSPNGCLLAPSIEAKTYGIKTGMRVKEAKLLYPKIIIREPDPPKYRDVHQKFKQIFLSYSPHVTPKSIDEAIIDFKGTENLHKKSLIEIGQEIKHRFKTEIGEWIRCSIGIGTNRFLAKLAAGLKKPDGLETIDHTNLIKTLKKAKLLDLCGINIRYQARLNIAGIYTPLEFFHATERTLSKQVFKSINGYYWYLRLRGWETDDTDFKRKSFGQSYALSQPTNNQRQLSKLLMKLTEKMGRRLRQHQYSAQGIHLACNYHDHTYWHHGHKLKQPIYTTQDLFQKAQLILNQQPTNKKVTRLAISCYNLQQQQTLQMELFKRKNKQTNISQACDHINNQFGEYTITPALMMNMQQQIIDRIAFGQ